MPISSRSMGAASGCFVPAWAMCSTSARRSARCRAGDKNARPSAVSEIHSAACLHFRWRSAARQPGHSQMGLARVPAYLQFILMSSGAVGRGQPGGARRSTTLSATCRRSPGKASTRAATSSGAPTTSMQEAVNQLTAGSKSRAWSTGLRRL